MLELDHTKTRTLELLVSHEGLGAQEIGPPFAAFPGLLAGSWTRSRAAGTATGTHEILALQAEA